jgi:uncharacterized membrane protein (DUF4010 family)
MVDLLLVQKMFFALAIGLIIGLEREISQEKTQNVKFAGLRTFGIAGLIGGICAYFSSYGNIIFVTALLSITILIGIAYYRSTSIDNRLGFTTELSLILTFLLGGMAYYEQTLAIIFTIIVTILLAFKKPLHDFSHKIQKEEFYDSLKFALIALVILPILPNQFFGPLDFFNPYEIWLIVVFISGISFIGYFLVKWFGASAGMALTGIVGGLASSTAVTTTMAIKTKEFNGQEFSAMVAVILANLVMLVRVCFLVLVFAPDLLMKLYIPISAMILTGLALVSYFYLKGSKAIEKGSVMQVKSPFSIKPALTFGLFFTMILFVSKAASIYLGNYGLYITAIFAGLADVDAITISTSQLLAQGLTATNVAIITIMLAVFVNLLIRIVYTFYFGTKTFAKYTILMALSMVAVGSIVVAYLYLW